MSEQNQTLDKLNILFINTNPSDLVGLSKITKIAHLMVYTVACNFVTVLPSLVFEMNIFYTCLLIPMALAWGIHCVAIINKLRLNARMKNLAIWVKHYKMLNVWVVFGCFIMPIPVAVGTTWSCLIRFSVLTLNVPTLYSVYEIINELSGGQSVY
jgi:hypothetical protein